MIIRAAHPADFDQMWPLLHDVFRAGETYAVDPAITADAARVLWMDQPVASYVALDGDQIIGTYYIKANQAGGGAHICNCGYIVSSAARGQGVARRLCEHSLSTAGDLGYRAMQFNLVLASNEGAVRLWHRLGFETVGTIPDAFAHPVLGYVDAYVMYRSLAD